VDERLSCAAHDGVELMAWRRQGSRPGAVLMLHGGGQSHHTWDQLVDVLASDGWTPRR
jgi:alpha-beta hydrolase superfamily lysophospholipase